MKCPHCGNDVEFKTYVEHNVEVYGKSVIGRTDCCGKALRVHRVIKLIVEPLSEYESVDSDDWGVPVEK